MLSCTHSATAMQISPEMSLVKQWPASASAMPPGWTCNLQMLDFSNPDRLSVIPCFSPPCTSHLVSRCDQTGKASSMLVHTWASFSYSKTIAVAGHMSLHCCCVLCHQCRLQKAVNIMRRRLPYVQPVCNPCEIFGPGRPAS